MKFKSILVFLLVVGVLCASVMANQPRAVLAGTLGSAGQEQRGRSVQADTPNLIKDINPEGSAIPYQFDKTQMISIGNVVYFSAIGDERSVELWKSDGSSSGTVIVKDIHPTDASWPTSFANLNGELFFVADDGVHGKEIWKSDGTEAGTQIVKDIYPGGGSSQLGTPSVLTASGSSVYFSANDGVHAYELWKSDGTVTGTLMVKEITPGGDLAWPYQYQYGMTDLNGKLLFSNFGGTSQYDWDLWVSDGTLTGTVMLKDFYGSMLENLTVMGDHLYFTVYDDPYGTELWKTDGTVVGTVMVKNINPGYNDGSDPANLIAINGTLFFSANDGTHGSELWKSDGTADGTVMVAEINASGGSFDAGCGNPPCAANVNGTLFFAANDGVNGLELWKSDGTLEGTLLVKNLRSGAGDGNPGLMIPAAGKLFLVVPNDIGDGLWVSDGTSEGTLMLKNFTGDAPARLTVAGDRLFFAADDESGIGKELWGVFLGEMRYIFLPLIRR